MTDDVNTRTIIITGAASPRGIGRETASYLAERGWSIGIIDRDADAAAEVAATLRSTFGISAQASAADVTNVDEVDAALSALEASLPPVLALATLAGVSSAVPYLDLDAAEWNRVLNINLNGVHNVIHRVARGMAERGAGRIVTISSVSAQRGGGTFSKTPYSVSKAAVIGLTRALARELGPHGITVNTIAPGPIDTDIMGGELTEERRQSFIREQFIQRVGSPRDVAAAIGFLVGDESGFITGHTLDVNGGLHLA